MKANHVGTEDAEGAQREKERAKSNGHKEAQNAQKRSDERTPSIHG